MREKIAGLLIIVGAELTMIGAFIAGFGAICLYLS